MRYCPLASKAWAAVSKSAVSSRKARFYLCGCTRILEVTGVWIGGAVSSNPRNRSACRCICSHSCGNRGAVTSMNADTVSRNGSPQC